MDVVFVTHNDLGKACLEELSALGASIDAIYTRPQRSDISDQTRFDAFARDRDIPLHAVDSVNDDDVVEQMRTYEPDLLFVVGWSQLVDPEIFELPSTAALGMHPSPLPRGRGRAPIAWSLIKGLSETALTCFHLTEAADEGDVAGQQEIEISIQDDAASLFEKVVNTGRELTHQVYAEFEQGNMPRIVQDESEATWWPRRRPHHGLIDWTQSPGDVYNWIRALTHPYPGAFSFLDGTKVRIWAANPPTGEPEFVTPGEIAYAREGALGVGAWEGVVELTRIQVEDDSEVEAARLVNDYDIAVGDQFAYVGDHSLKNQ